MGAFWTGVVAGYGIAIPVGAIAVLVIQMGLRSGFAIAFCAGAGAATADLIYATVAVIGGAALAESIQEIGRPFRVLSALVLVGLAIFGLWRVRSPVERTGSVRPTLSSGLSVYARFLGLTLINPTTVIYFAAVIVGVGVARDLTPLSGALFAIGAFLASLSWQTALAALGGLAGHRLSPRAETVAIVGGNLLIFGLAVWIVLG
jgi:threonine/homoserine/homoserine lactone efflux protein